MDGDLGTITLSDGRVVKMGRLPTGGLSAIRDALKGQDISALIRGIQESIKGDDSDNASPHETEMGIKLIMGLPEILIAYLKWTVFEKDGSIPSDNTFIDSIPVVDIPKLAEKAADDISDIVKAVKNLMGPVNGAKEVITGQKDGSPS